MALQRYHLQKKNDQWRLRKAGSNRSLLKADTNEIAILELRGYMKTREGSVRILVMIDTERLLLRRLKTSDLLALERILGDPEVMEFSNDGPLDRNRVESWLADQVEGYDRQNGVGILAVIRKSDSELIGYCGLSIFALPKNSECASKKK